MRLRAASGALWLFSFALIAGCVKSCDCGGKPASGAAATEGQATAGMGGKPGAGPPRPGNPLPSDPAVWTKAPDSELSRSLYAAKTQIEAGKVYDKLTPTASLSSLLHDKLGELTADGPVSSSEREGSAASVAVTARNYKSGGKSVRVKVIDTGRAPSARRAVSERLDMVGNEPTGNQHGLFLRGYPAVASGFEEQRLSRASALVGGRYLVQVLVTGATHPDDAEHLIEQLDFGKLAPKQGKIPKPETPAR